MPKTLKKILITAAGLAIIFIMLDFGYIWTNLRFELNQIPTLPKPIPASQAAQDPVAPNTLVINSLGIKAPIIYVNEQSEAAFQSGLATGVVHYPQTALPGQFGNCYLFGHSSDFFWKKGSYKNVFALLPRLKKGSVIVVSDQTGNNFTYIVTGSFRISGNDTSVLSQATGGKKLLTLQTSYPVGTALARWIVTAEMQ